MLVLFMVVLIIFGIACILVRAWLFSTVYKPWLDYTFLEYKNKDEESQLMHDSTEVEVKKEDEL